jgi:hypothetical protein
VSEEKRDPWHFLKLPDDGPRQSSVTGELPGVRDTMDKILAQEISGGAKPDVARAQVERIAKQYHSEVAAGVTSYPTKR